MYSGILIGPFESPDCRSCALQAEVAQLRTDLFQANSAILRQRQVFDAWKDVMITATEAADWATSPGAGFLRRQVERMANASPEMQNMANSALMNAIKAFEVVAAEACSCVMYKPGVVTDECDGCKAKRKATQAEEPMTHYDIIQKLIGPIQPIGDHAVDGMREANLDAMIELVNKLMWDITQAAEARGKSQHSVAAIGKKAQAFLEEVAAIAADAAGGKE